MRVLLFCMICVTTLGAQGKLERVASTAGDDVMGAPEAVAAGRNGEFFVADAKARHIVVYDSSGQRIRTIGRNGEGPGEFRSVSGLAWIADTLVVYDWRLRRLSFISTNGTLIRTQTWRADKLPNQFLGSGGSSLHVVAYGPGKQIPIIGIEGTRLVRPPKTFLQVNGDGSATPLDLPLIAPDPGGHDCWNDPKKSIHWTDNEPGGRGPFNAFTATGVFVYASDDRSQVRWRRRGSETQVTHPPVPVGDDLWRNEAAEILALERKMGKLTCSPPLVRPPALPPVRGIVADDRGGVWVEVTTATGSRFDVYDPAGKLTASVAAPVRRLETIPFVVRGDRLYLPVKGADDVVSISVYRLLRDAR